MIGSHFTVRRMAGLGALGVPGPTGIIQAQEGGKTDRASIEAQVEEVRLRQQGRAALARATGKVDVAKSRLTASWTPIAVMGGVLAIGAIALIFATRKRRRK